ncbi:MAG: hypothetical protein D6698_01560 [Gammaproteobacteria bacterium]|nr:MAG: hypothetical protein D6698_01560 [Gammaproteobacteria bacterium]
MTDQYKYELAELLADASNPWELTRYGFDSRCIESLVIPFFEEKGFKPLGKDVPSPEPIWYMVGLFYDQYLYLQIIAVDGYFNPMTDIRIHELPCAHIGYICGPNFH